MAFGIGLQTEAGLLDGAVRADAGDDIEQRLAVGRVHAHLVAGDERRGAGLGPFGQAREAARVVAAVEHLRAQETGAGHGRAETREGRLKGLVERLGRQDDEALPLGMGQEVLEGEAARALLGAPLAEREQAREAAIGGPVAQVAQDLGPVLRRQAGADEQPQPRLLGRDMGAHHAGQGVAVGDAHGRVAERRGGRDQLLRMRGGAQKAVVGRNRQLGVGGG